MRRAFMALLALVLFTAAGYLFFFRDSGEPPQARTPAAAGALEDSSTAPLVSGGTAPSPLAVRLDSAADPIQVKFKKPPRSAVVFDLDTGKVLWRRDPTKVLPIASLTKMMTALVVVERVPEGAKVRITKEALRYTGSGVGVLPRGKWIGVNTMLHGLMLPSGNDAAIALAQRAAGGSEKRFVRYMNEKAEQLGLLCTRFASSSGIVDKGNHSCAADLAAIARAVMREPRLTRIVKRRQAVLPFPIKGGRLWLYNHNPLLRAGYPGTTGLKTGYTDAAGRCLVATARRGAVKLGVVLLDSPDPGKQAMQLLDRGFKASST
ncbi:D-alanyl-D-alanine carboxypeptidase [Solirubrobacter sp. CPCC 204708]|uniref:D-alanyl-D-alanine carboxypeptidase n=1 Tax=Solirubrobacter deserti TaxID=2282478 RepID=A0ABT4RK59_9ACTN|nr:D-alanyl-D-alanine carboxypeptidase [Solirubrobacter deserti]MBE2316841.1 D-alanyl-D-alanine carboxypeptidase [Solirubrobacter deserti]MDA0138942.1 D-alanyl-D-alanine carboxypeptidase [Solirubrobacter deserti]